RGVVQPRAGLRAAAEPDRDHCRRRWVRLRDCGRPDRAAATSAPAGGPARARPSGASMKRLALLVVLCGCDIRSFNLSSDGGLTRGDGSGGMGGGSGGAGGMPDSMIDAAIIDGIGPDACVPRAEVCNGLDDDCDGVIDNGFNLNTDVNNCGMCGHQCLFTNASA